MTRAHADTNGAEHQDETELTVSMDLALRFSRLACLLTGAAGVIIGFAAGRFG